MTFIAETGDGPVVPEETDDGDELWCVECTESLGIVTAHRREDSTFVSRHFRHPPSESCGGGESDTHKAMKSIALSKMKEAYPKHTETSLDNETVGDRQPDAYLRFAEPHPRLGYGVVAEAQYRNKGKNIEAVTDDYLSAGYSVYWLYEDDYKDADVELGEPVAVWPRTVPEPSEWTGTNSCLPVLQESIRGEDSPCELSVPFPREIHNEQRTLLKGAWLAGRGEYDLVYRLKPNNASRRCDECGEDAMAYLFIDGHVSEFVCADHFPESEQVRKEVLA